MPVWAFVLALIIGKGFIDSRRFEILTPISVHICPSNWHDPGYHESASWSQVRIYSLQWPRLTRLEKCHNRVDNRLCTSWTPYCDDDVQDLGIHRTFDPNAWFAHRLLDTIWQTMAQALTFTSDFKLGHYMKSSSGHSFYLSLLLTTT